MWALVIVERHPFADEALGTQYGISKERVRQLRERSFRKLRDYLQNRGLTLDCFI